MPLPQSTKSRALELLLALGDTLSPTEVYATLIVAMRMAQGGLRASMGEDVEQETAAEAYMLVNRLEMEASDETRD